MISTHTRSNPDVAEITRHVLFNGVRPRGRDPVSMAAAHAEAKAKGVHLLLDGGEYEYTGDMILNWTNGGIIGNGAKINFTDGGLVLNATPTGHTFRQHLREVTINRFGTVGDAITAKSVQRADNPLAYYYVARAEWQSVHVEESTRHGIYMNGGLTLQIDRPEIANCAGTCLLVDMGNGSYVGDGAQEGVSGNAIDVNEPLLESSDRGLHVVRCSGFNVHGGSIEGHQRQAVVIGLHNTGFHIEGTRMEDNGRANATGGINSDIVIGDINGETTTQGLTNVLYQNQSIKLTNLLVTQGGGENLSPNAVWITDHQNGVTLVDCHFNNFEFPIALENGAANDSVGEAVRCRTQFGTGSYTYNALFQEGVNFKRVNTQ